MVVYFFQESFGPKLQKGFNLGSLKQPGILHHHGHCISPGTWLTRAPKLLLVDISGHLCRGSLPQLPREPSASVCGSWLQPNLGPDRRSWGAVQDSASGLGCHPSTVLATQASSSALLERAPREECDPQEAKPMGAKLEIDCQNSTTLCLTVCP